MSHDSQIFFVQSFVRLIRPILLSPNVVEIGSYNVNGSIRDYFDWVGKYVGVDLAAGQGVDVVGSGHEYGSSNSFDIAISCECFEHNPYWLETFINMIRVVRPEGFVLFTCATTGRPEHGTSRSDKFSNPGGYKTGWNYYRNLTRRDFISGIDLDRHFSHYDFFNIQQSQDLLFVGIKKAVGNDNGNEEYDDLFLNLSSEIDEIKKLLPEKPRDFPLLSHLNQGLLWLVARLFSDVIYQNFRFFWLGMVTRFVCRIK